MSYICCRVAWVERLLVHLGAIGGYDQRSLDLLLLGAGTRYVKIDGEGGSIKLNVGVVDSDGGIVEAIAKSGGGYDVTSQDIER